METQLRPVVEVAKNYSEPSSTHVQGELARDRDTAYTLLKYEIASMKGVYSAKDAIDKALDICDHVYGKTKEPLKDN